MDHKGEIVSNNNPENNKVDPSRILIYRFLGLSHIVRINIATKLDLYSDEDEGLKDAEVFERIFDRACSRDILALLWDKIEERYNDGKYPTNPFKNSSPIPAMQDMMAKKENLIFALEDLINSIKNADEIDTFKFNTINEIQQVPTRLGSENELTGWANVDFTLRFHRPRRGQS